MEHLLSSCDNLGGRTWDPNYTPGGRGEFFGPCFSYRVSHSEMRDSKWL